MRPKIHKQAIDAASGGPEEQAARWGERMREPGGDADLRAAFETWLACSAAHPPAFERMQAAHALAVALADTPQLQALRQETRARVHRRACRRRWGFALAASLLVAIGSGWLLAQFSAPDQWSVIPSLLAADARYQTGVGQRTVVRLEDGSVITLNTDSRIRVKYSPTRRELVLERGQALFEVAKNPARPFVVSAGDRRVTALGTRFDVLLSPRELEVTLLEGRVVVSGREERADAARRAPTELRPGQQFVVSVKSPPQVRRADVRQVASWVHGQLVFQDERLVDAITKMNRYSRRKIVLDDPQLASLRLSGAFNSGDVDAFAAALTDYFPVERELRRDAVVLRMRAPLAGQGPQQQHQ